MEFDRFRLELLILRLLSTKVMDYEDKYYIISILNNKRVKVSYKFFSISMEFRLMYFNLVTELDKFNYIYELNPNLLTEEGYFEDMKLLFNQLIKELNIYEVISLIYFIVFTNKQVKYKKLLPDRIHELLTNKEFLITKDQEE